MSEENTPGVGQVLNSVSLKAIPEAHCYLRIDDRRVDITSTVDRTCSPLDSLMLEVEINPEDIGERKVNIHKKFLRKWCESNDRTFEEIWNIRERCIGALGSASTGQNNSSTQSGF
jgi:hypothetical protein